MEGVSLRLKSLFLALFVSISVFSYAAPNPAAPLQITGLGSPTVALDGDWQFRTGDDLSWAAPGLDDSGWESIRAEKPWGQQQHFNYTGYAWYRRHIVLDPAIDRNLDLAFITDHIDNVYEIYWNGVKIGGDGRMPPNPRWSQNPGVRSYPLGKAQSGVLAVRVWKAMPFSSDSGDTGGFITSPMIGTTKSAQAYANAQSYLRLRPLMYQYALLVLYGMVGTLSLLAWFMDRSRKVILWMAAYVLVPFGMQLVSGFMFPMDNRLSLALEQPLYALHDISLWFLLVYLLGLDDIPKLVRWVRIFAWASILCATLDGIACLVDISGSHAATAQWADAALTVVTTITQFFALALIPFAFRKRHSVGVWLVAFFAFLVETLTVLTIIAAQGSRFTHSTLPQKLQEPLFTIGDSPFSIFTLSYTFLFISIVYAVYRSSGEESKRVAAMAQEFKSAQELQRILIPETLPSLPGFGVTSAYRPAQEVGGDFFQIITKSEGSALVVIGDVSGKGLKAAMTVSLIVGTLRTLAEIFDDPAEILSGLNRRLHGRLQNGFVTCLVLRLDLDGSCTIANAGHLSPYLNGQELALAGALPLGIVASVSYEEVKVSLEVGDRFMAFTDGLLEARNKTGELFSFERMQELIATQPEAKEAIETAVAFGQEDDITVLTITRLARGVESTTLLEAPSLASAMA
jgi:Stage II sporulation protein E (SpoIIE)